MITQRRLEGGSHPKRRKNPKIIDSTWFVLKGVQNAWRFCDSQVAREANAECKLRSDR